MLPLFGLASVSEPPAPLAVYPACPSDPLVIHCEDYGAFIDAQSAEAKSRMPISSSSHEERFGEIPHMAELSPPRYDGVARDFRR